MSIFDNLLNSNDFLYSLPTNFKIPAKSPKELLKFMDRIKYGWMDKNHKKYVDPTDEEWWNKVVIAMPDEVLKYKIGTCYEQSIFEYFVFKKYFKDTDNLKLIHLQQTEPSAHLILAYIYKNKWYRFEHSFEMFRGIHGPFKTIDDLINNTKKQMMQYSEKIIGRSSDRFHITYLDPHKLRKGLTAPEFLKLVDYKFDGVI